MAFDALSFPLLYRMYNIQADQQAVQETRKPNVGDGESNAALNRQSLLNMKLKLNNTKSLLLEYSKSYVQVKPFCKPWPTCFRP
jgi:hypothetical protein